MANPSVYLYIRPGEGMGREVLGKILTRVLTDSDYEMVYKKDVFFLTLKGGQNGLAILQSSLAAAGEDIGGSFKGLIVPLFSELFLPYIDLVPQNGIRYLFEVGYTHHEIYAETQELLDGIDSYTLLTVKSYIEAGNSPSLASNRLYVHRNTVTYRIDRFISMTGVEIKSFPNAVYIYFLIANRLKDMSELTF